jgi:hypothetical protein
MATVHEHLVTTYRLLLFSTLAIDDTGCAMHVPWVTVLWCECAEGLLHIG